MVNHT